MIRRLGMLAAIPWLCAVAEVLSADAPPAGAALESLRRNGHREAYPVHDPSTPVQCNGEFWIFCTGAGVQSWRSKDLAEWKRGPRVFEAIPGWVTNIVAQQRGHFWAPEVIFRDGRYLLYYSVSRFGVNTSAIALASNPTLDPDDPRFKWTDEGIVLRSQRTNDYNAIDPHLIQAPGGELWMSFGSFWSGIKLVQLDSKTGLRLAADSPIHALAFHNEIEAPAIHYRDGYFYLFVNWGRCCRGANSTYEIRVGRSRRITGPYLDKEGADLTKGGGTPLLGSEGAFVGPGHAGIFDWEGKSWFSCHFYDTTQLGRATLALRPLRWDALAWPVLDPAPEE